MKVPPAAVINIIRENLNDCYRKGFPILKELVQNADDAGAAQLNLGWVKSLGMADNKVGLEKLIGFTVISNMLMCWSISPVGKYPAGVELVPRDH